MTERCEKCGAELFAGQQFCRRCGAPVAGAREDAPTKILQPGGPNSGPVNSGPMNSGPVNSGPVNSGQVDSGPFAGTSPLGGGGHTDAVGPKPATAYQPRSSYAPTPPSFGQAQTPAGFQHTSPLVGQPFGSQPLTVGASPRKSRGWIWLVALLVVFLLGGGAIAGAGYMIWRAKHPIIVRHIPPNGPNVPMPPDVNIPTDLGDRINKALKAAGVPQPLDESGATVTGTDTVITKTFHLDDDATFSVQGLTGNFTITGADGDQAELKVTKHGGSPEERKAAKVMMSQTDERVLLVGGGPPSGGVELSYEIKLPRDLSKVEINSDHGDLKFAGLGGAVNVNLRQGNLEFDDLTGAVHGRLVNGDVKVSLDKSDRDGDQDISVVNGNIEATVADGADVNLKGESITGDISADDSLGLKVAKRPAGHAVSGQLGDGGHALELKTVNGGIKLKKQ